MMLIMAYTSAAYLAVRLLVALVNLLTRPSLKPAQPAEFPLVSVLIPARNEENNIVTLLEDLTKVKYPEFEILVYDDDSSDQTSKIVSEAANNNHSIRYMRGNGPEKDWLGKNYACDQLAREAKGDYFIFLDADVRVTPEIINDSLAFMQKYKLSLLSLFPVQVMKSPGEWLTVPIMNRILVGNLPMFMVLKSKMAAFAAANGQFMAFDGAVYRKNLFHRELRAERVEDILIARLMKVRGYRIHTLLSGGQVSCRMYKNYREGLSGFSKNIYAFFGNSWLLLLLYCLFTALGPFAVWIAISTRAVLIYVSALVAFSLLVSLQSRQPILKNIVLMPLQQFSVLMISILAAYKQITGKFSWKGRQI